MTLFIFLLMLLFVLLLMTPVISWLTPARRATSALLSLLPILFASASWAFAGDTSDKGRQIPTSWETLSDLNPLHSPLHNRLKTVQSGSNIAIHVLRGASFYAKTPTPPSGAVPPPVVQVDEEYAGFECRVQSITLATNAPGSTPTQTLWRIDIDWAPGADTSGCLLRVTHQNWEREAKVHLYMAYLQSPEH